MVRKLIEKVMIQTLFCRMDYQNGSASKTSMIQLVAHAEKSRSGASGKRMNGILINIMEKHKGYVPRDISSGIDV